MAHVVAQADEVCAALEQVRQKAQALGGLRVDELEELRHLDDARRADDADSETLGDGELEALGFLEVHIVDERLVAFWAEERRSEVDDGLWEGARDGLERGA